MRSLLIARSLLNQRRRQRGPAGLVAGTHTAASVAVEVLVEQHEIFPSIVGSVAGVLAVDRALTVVVGRSPWPTSCNGCH